MALAAGGAFIESLKKFVLLFGLQRRAAHNTPQGSKLASCRYAFTLILGIHRAPYLALTAPGTGFKLNELSPGQTLGDPVALCFFISGQYMSFLSCSS